MSVEQRLIANGAGVCSRCGMLRTRLPQGGIRVVRGKRVGSEYVVEICRWCWPDDPSGRVDRRGERSAK